MTAETWQQLGARIDRRLNRQQPQAPKRAYRFRTPEEKAACARNPRTPAEKIARALRETKPDRAAELIEAERAYEAMMTERIRTEGAVIKAENLERKRTEEVGPGYRQREVRIYSLPGN